MSSTVSDGPLGTAPPATTGDEKLLPRLVTRFLFRQAQVDRNEMLVQGLHRIELSGPALCGAHWVLGDKLQIKTGAGLQTRTYTPVFWDAEGGRTAFLAHTRAPGPGSEWVQRAGPGQPIAVFGPRRSLDLAALDASHGVLIGDETAIGLAAAWRPTQTLIEVDRSSALQPVMDALGLSATLIERDTEERHVQAMADAALTVGTDRHFVLVGRARTVQTLLRTLRAQGVASSRIRTKAYWADGKAGLD